MDRVYINGDGIQLTNADIVQNSLTIDRYSVTGANIELGSAVAAELSFKMFNSDGCWDDFAFEGKDLFVRVNDVPMGYFTVDEPPRKLSTITIRALDRMVQFDQPYETDLLFPVTVADIISDCCDKCDIVIGNLDLINEDVVINEKPQADTFRTVLRWCAEITGTCAYIDGNGELQMSWYKDSDFEIDGSIRYEGSDFYKEPIQITGVKYKDVLVGTDEYAIEIIGNLILYNMKELEPVLGNIYNRINGLVYHPYNVVVKSQIGLMPLQKIKYVDKNNAEYPSIVTHHTYRLNGRSTVKAVGQTKTRKGYAALNPVTPHEQEILQNMREETREELTGYETLLLHLNEQINNSLGLYTTVKTDSEGRKIVYAHDKPNLEDSMYISIRTAAGFAWTNEGWNEGFPNWRYGIDFKGNAILNQIAAIGIDSEWIKTNSISVSKIESKGFLDLIAEKINLYGLVTFHGLDNELKGRVESGELAKNLLDTVTMMELGVTKIDGGKIATNTIAANALAITDFSEVGATLSGWTLTPTEIRGTYSNLATVIRTPTHLADVVFQTGDAESPSVRIFAWGKLEARNAEIKGSVSATAFEVLNGDGDKIGGLYGSGNNAYLAAGRLVNPQNITGTNLRVGIVDGHALDGTALYRNNTPYMTFRNGSWFDGLFVENEIISIGRRLKLTTYTDKTRTDNPEIFLGDYTTTYDGIMLVGNHLYIRAPLGMRIENTAVSITDDLLFSSGCSIGSSGTPVGTIYTNYLVVGSGEIFFKGKYLYVDPNGYVRGV